MPQPLADPVDVGVLSVQETGLERDYALAELGRLAAGLADTAGRAHAELRFHRLDAVPALEGTVTATVAVVCQRCLTVFGWPVTSTFRLAFVRDAASEATLPPDYEGVVTDDDRVALRDLVEDELLLALPLVPKHPRVEECEALAREARGAGHTAPAEGGRQPFAVLKDLLSK
jgi:uncharacterized protein